MSLLSVAYMHTFYRSRPHGVKLLFFSGSMAVPPPLASQLFHFQCNFVPVPSFAEDGDIMVPLYPSS